MSKVEDTLWNHLVEHHGADRAQVCPSGASRPRKRPLAIATAATGAAAVAAALIILATTSTPPAYALISHADGSITITLKNLTTGIPQLNSRLQQMGINFTVIPVRQNCSTSTAVLGAAPGSLSETITIGTQNMEPAGVDGYLAAEQLPNGQIGLASGGMKAPLPSCFSPTLMKTQPIPTPNSSSAAGKSLTSSTTTSSPPLPVPAAVRRQLKAANAGRPVTSSTTTSLPPITSK